MSKFVLKSWRGCPKCGYKKYPNANANKMAGITITFGICETCGKNNQVLIPWSDFEYASGDDSKWD